MTCNFKEDKEKSQDICLHCGPQYKIVKTVMVGQYDS